jgi:hypothetical protein
MVFSLLQSVSQILVEESLMLLEGDVVIRAPRKRVWDAPTDHQFGQCGPGWKRVKRISLG